MTDPFVQLVSHVARLTHAKPTAKHVGIQFSHILAMTPWPVGCRKMLGLKIDVTPDEFIEDAKLFFEEGVTIGLRSPWMRRVCVPIVMAHRAMSNAADPERFNKALEILSQCDDPVWQELCKAEVRSRHDTDLAVDVLATGRKRNG